MFLQQTYIPAQERVVVGWECPLVTLSSEILPSWKLRTKNNKLHLEHNDTWEAGTLREI